MMDAPTLPRGREDFVGGIGWQGQMLKFLEVEAGMSMSWRTSLSRIPVIKPRMK